MWINYLLPAMSRRALALLPLVVVLSRPTATAQTDNLRRYIDCNFGAKVSVEESDENAKPFVRSVSTAEGSKEVLVLHGFSLHIAYAGTPFVNFKAERLASFRSAKENLIQNLTLLTAGSREMEANAPRRSSLNGFDIYAINRRALAGGVQSVYLLFRDVDQTAVTLYILDTPPEAPQFSTIEQYRALRDRFVQTYTACVARNLGRRSSRRVDQGAHGLSTQTSRVKP
jgi:hypothetical protein